MNTIEQDIDNLKAGLDSLYGRINAELSLSVLKPLKLIEYPKAEDKYSDYWNDFKIYRTRDSYYHCDKERIPIFKHEAEAHVALDAILKTMYDIATKNKEIIDHNKGIIERLTAFFVGLGFPLQTTVNHGVGRKRRSSWVDAHWVTEMKRNVPVKDEVYEKFLQWYESEKKAILDFYASIRSEEAKKKAEQEAKDKVDRAVQFLLDHGKKLGEDFSVTTAISDATGVRFEELIKEQEGNTVKQSYCSECSQWIAGEPRCSCGNCRIAWGYDGDFENLHIYPAGN